MTPQPTSTFPTTSVTLDQKTSRRWLLFVHQLPATPSNLRVQTWRRLQQFGALPRKQSVYLLPDTPATREDIEWLTTQIKDAGGEAEVFIGRPADPWADDGLVEEFRCARQEAYALLTRDIERAVRRLDIRRRPGAQRAPSLTRLLDGFRQRFAAIERIDFFGSVGHDRVVQLITELDERVSGRRDSPGGDERPERSGDSYKARVWVTRPRPGVDRMSSAWLIQRFIDPQARFAFAPDARSVPAGALPFDMYGVQFSHRGDACTFETLCSTFKLHDKAVTRLAEIVHDLDLKDERFGAAEAATVATLIEGLQLAHGDDDVLLAEGMKLFDSLYRGFTQSSRLSGPRAVAQRVQRRRRKR